jgi:endonuclease/exonuclease/phosphatase family metal-dependent hydrolase
MIVGVIPFVKMTSLKIMTFNIAVCREPSRGIIDVARTIELEEPDFVAMQEVDRFTRRSGVEIDQSSELAHHAHFSHMMFIPSMDFQGGQYGNAILSRHYFDTVVLAHLDGRNQGEPRSMGIFSFKISNDQQVFFGVIHLEHEIESLREAQAKDAIELYRRNGLENQPFILAGDFNDEPNSRTVQLLLTEGGLQLPCDQCPKTFPADNPTRTIDYIFLNQKAMDMFELKSYRTSDMNKSSDHLPLIMELKRK